MRREYGLVLNTPLPPVLLITLASYIRDQQGTPWILCFDAVQDGTYLRFEALNVDKVASEIGIPAFFVIAILTMPDDWQGMGFNAPIR